MDVSEKDHRYSELTENSARQPHEVKQDIPVVTRRLRDRELLKRKKEEAQEKDTFLEQASKRQRKGKGTGRGRRKHQVKEPEPDPEGESAPEPEPEFAPEPEPAPEPEVSAEQTENGQEHLQHHIDPVITVSEENLTPLLVHEEADGHVPHGSTTLITEKHEELEAGHAPLGEIPEPLSFHLDPEQEEHQYYTPSF
ncbi:hemogen isoform 2-T2 [Rhinophrynus dorsalis]